MHIMHNAGMVAVELDVGTKKSSTKHDMHHSALVYKYALYVSYGSYVNN